ncbi:hypothetical protein ACIBEJ_30525 [Nonomuraea sp. NPDC050790]|uniref:hypothetical protein n=1 Tax=Nonomuraea sp. NPDC050790 TaxID=3364371 RepID=UPI0037971E2E
MSRHKLVNGLLLGFTMLFAVFAVVAPAEVVRPVSMAVLGLIAACLVGAVVWATSVVRRRRMNQSQNQPSA